MFPLNLLGFFTSAVGKYVLIAAAVLALLGGVFLKGKSVQHVYDDKALTALRDKDAAALSQCHTNVQAVEASLAAQNAAVDGLRADSDARLAKSAKAAQDARAVAESYRRNAGSILAAKAGPDQCASADQLIAEAVK